MTGVLARVLASGFATVQDGGRPGYTQLGVPVSGAFHRARYMMTTALVCGSADPTCPAIELLEGELVLALDADGVIAVVGDVELTVDDRAVSAGTATRVPTGGVVRIVRRGRGPAYLVMDGWHAPRVLGSAATDTFSGLGGGLLRVGDVLTGRATVRGVERVGAFLRQPSDEVGRIRVAAAGHLSLRAFAAATWTVTAASRSGIRLSGGPIETGAPIASMPMVPGAIQLTPSGEAIVLGPDGGLTGGYPVVAVVTTVDLDRISLLRLGDEVAFRSIEVAQAAMARAESLVALRRALAHPADLA
jgi:allophanate hydrolase subunit 2